MTVMRRIGRPLATATALAAAIAATLLAGSPASADATAAVYTYPAAPAGPQVDTYFGVQVPDPYRWLENPKNPQTTAWVNGESALAKNYLASLPTREARHAQLTGLVNYDRTRTPTMRGKTLFFTKDAAGAEQGVVYVAANATAKPRALLDANKLSASGTTALVDYVPSWNARYMVYSTSESGSDWETLHVKNVATGKDLPDQLDWVKFSATAWSPDDTGFYYSRYAKPKNPLQAANKNHKIYFHRIGTPQSSDQLVFADPKHPLRNVYADVDPDAKILWVYVSDSAGPNNQIYYQLLDRPSSRAVPLFTDGTAEYYPLATSGSTTWMLTTRGAPDRRVVKFSLKHPAERNWTNVVPEQTETMESASVVGKRIVTTFLKDATDRIRIFDLAGHEANAAALPGLGSASGFQGGSQYTSTYYTFTSYTSPVQVMRIDARTGTSTVWAQAHTTFDTSQVVSEQVFVTSKDGTKVPLFLVRRKDVAADGTNPTLLYGYGGFGVSITPSYSSQIAAWVQNGGIYAEAVLRGGGEYGQTWYEDGTLLHKQNVFDDFIACGQWLVDNRWTRSDRLAIKGESNGGLLVGAVLTQRPDLMGAALAGVGVLDMLRYQEFTIGSAWAGDYGLSSDSAEMFNYLLGYSPLHNVKPGVAYPATLITTGDHDDRVVPAHSYKFAATLQADNVSANPIIIRIDTDAGHGGGAGLSQTIDLWSDELAFLDTNLGTNPIVPAPTFVRSS